MSEEEFDFKEYISGQLKEYDENLIAPNLDSNFIKLTKLQVIELFLKNVLMYLNSLENNKKILMDEISEELFKRLKIDSNKQIDYISKAKSANDQFNLLKGLYEKLKLIYLKKKKQEIDIFHWVIATSKEAKDSAKYLFDSQSFKDFWIDVEEKARALGEIRGKEGMIVNITVERLD